VRFVLDQSVPPELEAAFVAAGHKVERGEGGLIDDAIVRQCEPVTATRAVAESFNRRVLGERRLGVFLHATDAEAPARLFARFKRLTPGRLYTVTAKTAKVRQLPQDSPKDSAT
jgi:hypothetical protein